ncbi:unnamed protein product [Mesocestoides corti]|uniref:2-(3-amino-3-carboxypropyl)histidine synthase subunit 2 n=2 Tax=Mesocestoides corti TaxID=53468 RepID=A0A0R3UBC0_MESCO|nr:unnamed protein product [Mesocestoides corti]
MDASFTSCFDISEAVAFINENGYSRVGLQLTSDLLIYSVDAYEQFCKQTSASIVILGDTPYSSCCVDELAGSLFGVDAIIHFGNACLTKSTGKVAVFYVFGNIKCPLVDNNLVGVSNKLFEQISSLGGAVLFAYDFRFRETARGLADHLLSKSLDVWFSEPAYPCLDTQTSSQFLHAGRIFKRTGASSTPNVLVYVGECDSAFYRILVSLGGAYQIKAYTVDPLTGQVAEATKSASSFLRRRYYLMERARSARRIGILMGTLSASRYPEIVARLKRLLKRAKKPFTTVVVGRINEAKLLNLPDLDALVLVACPQASVFDDPSLIVPVVTPYEMECVLYSLCGEDECRTGKHPREWMGTWLPLDFVADILDTGAPSYAPEESVVPSEIPVHDSDDPTASSSRALVCRDEANWSLALACEDLASRGRDAWLGLDPQLGQTPPLTSIQPGRSGVPTNYSTMTDT